MKPPTGATPLIAIAAAAIDTETTGLDATKARVVQIGAVGIARGKVVREFQFDLLVDPGEAIPSAASLVHGITGADVGGAATSRMHGRGSRSSSQTAILVGHSIGFDLAVLEAGMPTRPFALEQASGAMRPASCKPGESQSGGPFAGQDRRLARPGDSRPPFGSGRCDRGRRHLCRADSGIAQAQHPDTGRGRGGLPCAFARLSKPAIAPAGPSRCRDPRLPRFSRWIPTPIAIASAA